MLHEGKHGRTSPHACGLHHRKPRHRARRGEEVRREQIHRAQGPAGPPAPIRPLPLPSGQGGAGGKQGPAPHPRRSGDKEKVQGRVKLFSRFSV